MSNSYYNSTFTAAIGTLARSSTLRAQFLLVETGVTAMEAALAPKASPTFTGNTTLANVSYSGTLTGGTGVVNIGSGQFYKDSSGSVGIGTTTPSAKLDVVQGSGDGGLQYRSSTRTIGIGQFGGVSVPEAVHERSRDRLCIGPGQLEGPLHPGLQGAARYAPAVASDEDGSIGRPSGQPCKPCFSRAFGRIRKPNGTTVQVGFDHGQQWGFDGDAAVFAAFTGDMNDRAPVGDGADVPDIEDLHLLGAQTGQQAGQDERQIPFRPYGFVGGVGVPGNRVVTEEAASEDAVLVEQRDRILIITINRPQAKNAVNSAVSNGLAAAADRLDEDPGLSVGVLTGAGGSFCAGMDLKAFAKGENIISSRGFGLTQRPPAKPLIAAVEGYALAGGTELALSADLIVASNEIGRASCRERVSSPV